MIVVFSIAVKEGLSFGNGPHNVWTSFDSLKSLPKTASSHSSVDLYNQIGCIAIALTTTKILRAVTYQVTIDVQRTRLVYDTSASPSREGVELGVDEQTIVER